MRKTLTLVIPILAMLSPANAQTSDAKLPWLHEGLRLTYQDVEWVYPVSDGVLHEDASGEWCGRDGSVLSASQRGGTSSTAINEETVTCLTGNYLLLAGEYFTVNTVGGFPAPIPFPQSASTKSYSASDADQYWKPPEKLAQLHDDPNQSLKVTHLQWRQGNTAHDAVRLEYSRPDQNYYEVEVYDLHTGQCLHVALITTKDATRYNYWGVIPETDVSAIQCDLIGSRDVTVPWANEPFPDSLKSIHVLHYTGDSTLGPARTQQQMDFTFEKWGDGWVKALLTHTAQMPGYPPQQDRGEIFLGHCTLTPFWIPPAYLARMTHGQVFDTDDATQSKTAVLDVNDKAVIIQTNNTSGLAAYQYDKTTGLLIGQRTAIAGMVPSQMLLRLSSRE